MNSAVQPSSSPAAPTVVEGKLVFSIGAIEVEVDPATGGRIVALRFEGRDLLTGEEIDPANYGSTFWTSPQADWGWPPNPYLDIVAYTWSLDGATASLVSQQFNADSQGTKPITVEKRFTANVEAEAFDIEYVIANQGDTAFELAPWEISRVAGGGLTFFPTGESEMTAIDPHGELPTTKCGGVTWFAHGDFTPGDQGAKLNADGKEGWLAHVDGDVLFLKVFDDVAADAQAPGEGEVEIFASPDGAYVEVENQGAYATIPPGESGVYRVRWLVRPLPSGVSAEAGSSDLADFVRSLL